MKKRCSLEQQNNNHSTIEPKAVRPNARASHSAANTFDHLTKMTDLANSAPGKFRNVGLEREENEVLPGSPSPPLHSSMTGRHERAPWTGTPVILNYFARFWLKPVEALSSLIPCCIPSCGLAGWRLHPQRAPDAHGHPCCFVPIWGIWPCRGLHLLSGPI